MRCGPVNISVSIHHQRTNKHKDVFLFIINIMPNYSNGKIYKVVNDNVNIKTRFHERKTADATVPST